MLVPQLICWGAVGKYLQLMAERSPHCTVFRGTILLPGPLKSLSRVGIHTFHRASGFPEQSDADKTLYN